MRVEVTLLVGLLALAPIAARSQAAHTPPTCPAGKRTCPELDKWNRAHPRRAVQVNSAGAVVVNKPPADQQQQRKSGAVVVNSADQNQKTVREFKPATTTPAAAPPPPKKK
jgi:hypothetical protein